MKINVLIENRPSESNPQLSAEWGLSLYITFNGRSILFDTGASGAFAENAKQSPADIESVAAAVLSHYHFDHGGGIRKFLELNSRAKVYVGQPPDGDCIGKKYGFIDKYVGLDTALMLDYPARFEIIRETTEILPDVFIFPRILNNHPKPAGNKHLFLKKDHTLTPDNFAHEIVMAIKENGKLAVFTGCSHHGILNMVDTVAKAFAGVPIKAVFGGFHLIGVPPLNLMGESKREVKALARSMLDYPVEATYTGHCTGTQAFRVLKSVMGDRIIDMRTGSCFEV